MMEVNLSLPFIPGEQAAPVFQASNHVVVLSGDQLHPEAIYGVSAMTHTIVLLLSIYLTGPSLSCSMWDLPCVVWNLCRGVWTLAVVHVGRPIFWKE